MDWKILLAIGFVILLLVWRGYVAWRDLRNSEKMLEKVDKSKLKELDKDGWDDD